MADKLWRIRVEEDGYKFLPGESEAFAALAKSLVGEDCQLMLRKEPKQRSLDQNAYIHAEVFPKMAKWMGCSIEECKLAMLGECFGYEWNELVGRYFPRRPHTSKLKVAEMSEFIEWAPMWAAEFTEGAVIILLPNESIWGDE